MEEYIQAFCNYRKEKKQVSENTMLAYRSDLQRMITYLRRNGITSVEQITETQLNSFILAAEREGLKASSVVRLISSIHSFFDYLTKKGILKDDPSERIKAPKAEQAKQEIISVEELETLLAAPDTDTPKGLRDRAMLELLYATGIHLNSLLSLTLSQVHLRYKVLTVSVGDQNRVLPLGKPACDALEAYLERGREVLRKEHSEPELLFYNKAGEEMTRQGFFKRITEYTKKAGLPNITPRTLRNSMIHHLMSNGASYAGVHQLLGTKRLSAAMNFERQTQTIPDMYKKAHPRA
ncbi:MAG: tyrosine-type recombinase/integrase [Lachnospiraceae bacterium]|nr:tyrosine-type recombinase/integrase [Lachnospiraceae bacterium]MBQ8547360.1 tyrosine-type recombinase/integrase [Lachnospiraceae bacterium]MBQ8845685.1 tyrosine-type recombinase/integrase [Lachnospiraceae bacterium]